MFSRISVAGLVLNFVAIPLMAVIQLILVPVQVPSDSGCIETPQPNVLTEELTSKHMYRLRSQRKKAGLAHSTINKEIYLVSGALVWLADTQELGVPNILWKNLVLKPFKKKR